VVTSLLFYGCVGGRSFYVDAPEPIWCECAYFTPIDVPIPEGWLCVWRCIAYDAKNGEHKGIKGVWLSIDVESIQKDIENLKQSKNKRK